MIRLLTLILLLPGAIAVAQDEAELLSAEDWYRTVYAPLYGDKPSDHADEIAASFAETIHDHGDGGWLITEYATISCDEHGL